MVTGMNLDTFLRPANPASDWSISIYHVSLVSKSGKEAQQKMMSRVFLFAYFTGGVAVDDDAVTDFDRGTMSDVRRTGDGGEYELVGKSIVVAEGDGAGRSEDEADFVGRISESAVCWSESGSCAIELFNKAASLDLL